MSKQSRSELLFKLKEEIGEYPVYKSYLNILLTHKVFELVILDAKTNNLNYERVINYNIKDFSLKKCRNDLLTIFAEIVKFN